MSVVDLLGRNDEKVQIAEPVPSRLIECTDRVEPGQQTGLHIAGTGTEQLVAIDAHRPLGRRSYWEYGVGVTEQHHVSRAGTLADGQNVVARGLFFQALYVESEFGQLFLEPILHLIDAGLVVTAGIDAREIPQVIDILSDLRFEPAHDRFAHAS